MLCCDSLSFATGLFRVWISWCVCPSDALPACPQWFCRRWWHNWHIQTAKSENSKANSSDDSEDPFGILRPWNLPLASQGLGHQLRTLMADSQVCFQINRHVVNRMTVHCEEDDIWRFLHFNQFPLQFARLLGQLRPGLREKAWAPSLWATSVHFLLKIHQLCYCGKQ